MPDIPRDVLPLAISSLDTRYTAEDTIRVLTNPGMGNITWGAANLAVGIPFQLPFAYPVERWFFATGGSATSAASVQFGIYTDDFKLLHRTGSGTTGVALPGRNGANSGAAAAGAQGYAFLGSDLVIGPMSGYMVMALSSITASQVRGFTAQTALLFRQCGIVQSALASLDLPATFAPAVYAQTYFPLFGFSRTPTGN